MALFAAAIFNWPFMKVTLSVYPQRILFSRHEKIKKKDPKHIFASEEMNGEVRFSTHLPQPHSLCG